VKANAALAAIHWRAIRVADDGLYTDFCSAVELTHLANEFGQVYLCASNSQDDPTLDHRIDARNITYLPLPDGRMRLYLGAVGALRKFHWAISRADYALIRAMSPLVILAQLLIAWYRVPSIVYLIGNPAVLLRTHRRFGWFKMQAALLYVGCSEWLLRIGRWISGGAFLTAGSELAERFASKRTYAANASVLLPENLFERDDTCTGPVIRVVLVAYVRPEKGIEYALRAWPLLKTRKRVELWVVGSRAKFPEYQRMLDEIVQAEGLENRVKWAGHAGYAELWKHLRAADVLILPTLSEGTCRSQLEARAVSLPVVISNVGGIPRTITDGFDGMLVPPKDPAAIAAALDRLIEDGEFRRRILRNGYETVKSRCMLSHFVERVVEVFDILDNDRARRYVGTRQTT
jgi:glycosyltransferase involved in cell wall biosynthesis